MVPTGADKIRAAMSAGDWDRAVALLQQLGPGPAAGVMMAMPFEEQRVLFRVIPDEFAAQLTTIRVDDDHSGTTMEPPARRRDSSWLAGVSSS